jgi:hypothetical protein
MEPAELASLLLIRERGDTTRKGGEEMRAVCAGRRINQGEKKTMIKEEEHT